MNDRQTQPGVKRSFPWTEERIEGPAQHLAIHSGSPIAYHDVNPSVGGRTQVPADGPKSVVVMRPVDARRNAPDPQVSISAPTRLPNRPRPRQAPRTPEWPQQVTELMSHPVGNAYKLGLIISVAHGGEYAGNPHCAHHGRRLINQSRKRRNRLSVRRVPPPRHGVRHNFHQCPCVERLTQQGEHPGLPQHLVVEVFLGKTRAQDAGQLRA